jgi:hypothetical protein
MNHYMRTSTALTVLLAVLSTSAIRADSAKAAETEGNQALIGDPASPPHQARHRPTHVTITQLRQKKADGTITPQEQTVLDQIDQPGSRGSNGRPPAHSPALSPEERQVRHQQLAALHQELLTKKEAGTLTPEEQAQLTKFEQGPPHRLADEAVSHRKGLRHVPSSRPPQGLRHSTSGGGSPAQDVQ